MPTQLKMSERPTKAAPAADLYSSSSVSGGAATCMPAETASVSVTSSSSSSGSSSESSSGSGGASGLGVGLPAGVLVGGLRLLALLPAAAALQLDGRDELQALAQAGEVAEQDGLGLLPPATRW
mmetsp:Transcript_31979/g.104734  ORF Transcript_31979/g.104734 Transcript_31979/m.104734 type:complete len:124 (-) Transcript_31979:35-406(-)